MMDIKGIIELAVILLALIGTIIYMKLGTHTPPGWEKGKLVKLLIALEVLSLLIVLAEKLLLPEDPLLVTKNEAGKGSSQQSRILNAEGMAEDYEFDFLVPERVLSPAEADAAFLAAQQEIDQTFIGENSDIDHICTDVVMRDSYADGIISAAWTLDSYTYIQTSGVINNAGLKEPVTDYARVSLSYGDDTRIYKFPFRIVPVPMTPSEEFIAGVRASMEERFEENASEGVSSLPDSYSGTALEWEIIKKDNGILIFGIGLVVILGLGIGKVAEERKKEEQRRDRLRLQYSEVLSVLSLLLGAGMSVRKAWEKMVNNYFARNGPVNDAYEEMAVTLRQMQDGESEIRAIEGFGKRCALPAYRKLSGILATYIQKGSRGITAQLSNEVELAFEERKALARIAGEQAGTKLLVPMIMLLGVTLVIIIVPAILSFSF